MNAGGSQGTSPSIPKTSEAIQVGVAGCDLSCQPRHSYRIRLQETTYSIARFNNTGGQVSSVLIQNTGTTDVRGYLYFWSDSGALLATVALGPQPQGFLAPKALVVIDTSSIPALQDQSGSVTVSNDARYGMLSGKAVTFNGIQAYETQMEPRR